MTIAPLTQHPAKFTDTVLDAIQALVYQEGERLGARPVVLDPFAGVGRIHDLRMARTFGVEIEPEWAACREKTRVGDARNLDMFRDGEIDMVATSPCYGNRLADSHDPKDGSKRMGYKFSLGRDPSPDSAATLQWNAGPTGDKYRYLHIDAIREMVRVVGMGGLIVVNMSNHIRGGAVQRVVEWWISELLYWHELVMERVTPVATSRLKFGRNHEARVATEHLIVVRKIG